MKIGDQVCSLESAKRLNELGVNQQSLFKWLCWPKGSIPGDLEKEASRIVYQPTDACGADVFSAFTVAELGEMLPAHLQIDKYQSSKFLWSINWTDMKSAQYTVKADTEVDARAKVLIHLIEKSLIKGSLGHP